jgi:hypothetical protein
LKPSQRASKNPQLTEKNPYTELNVLQRRFVEARMQGLAIGAAGKAAGCKSQQHASTLERSPKVRKAIKYLIKDSTRNVKELGKSDVMTGELGKLIGAYEPEKKILEIHDYTKDELKQMSDEELLGLSGNKYADVIDAEFEEIKRHTEGKEVLAVNDARER